MKYIVEDELKRKIQKKLENAFSKTIDNPVVKAHHAWNIISEQMLFVLGPEVHKQWFSPIKPILLKNNNLILQTESVFAAQWINTHYQELADLLVLTQDKKWTCFFIAPKIHTYSNTPERK